TVLPGDTVVVRAGTYAGFVLGWDHPQTGLALKRICFHADPGVVIISRNSKTPDGINLEGAGFVDIDGFTIRNDSSIGRAGIRAVNGSQIHLTNNAIDGAGRWGIFTSHCDDVLIESNDAANSVKEHGIYVSNSGDRPVIRRNRVWGNRAAGIQING